MNIFPCTRTYYAQGRVFEKIGERDAALAAIQQGLNVDPDDVLLLDLLRQERPQTP